MSEIEKITKNIQMATALGYPLSAKETKFLDEALKEKAERDSGCEFCNGNYAIMSGSRMTVYTKVVLLNFALNAVES